MNLKPLVALAALFLSGTAIAEEYQSFSYIDYTDFDFGPVEEDGWILSTSYYLDERPALGPLEHGRPVLGVSSARSGIDRQQGVAPVVFSGQ